MPRPSYGPKPQQHCTDLLAALLVYAQGEVEGDDRTQELWQRQIQVQWQDDRRLVVRTKIRHLVQLTRHCGTPLSGSHIKEALTRLEDFVAILEDNRPSRSGSEHWHFTLKLWHCRHDRAANLRQLQQVWADRRGTKTAPPQTSASQGDQPPTPPQNPPSVSLTPALCHASLVAQQGQDLTLNPLMTIEGLGFQHRDLYVPLALQERLPQVAPPQQRVTDATPGEDDPTVTEQPDPQPEAGDRGRRWTGLEFLEQLGIDLEPDATPDVKPDVKPDATPNVKPESELNAKPNATPDVKPGSEPNATPDATPEPEPNIKPESEPNAKPDATPDVTSGSEPNAKPNATPEPEPNAKRDAKPEPNATPEPNAEQALGRDNSPRSAAPGQPATPQRIALVGEPGAGKTTLLQRIAQGLLAQGKLALWVTLGDLQGKPLGDYLRQEWLQQATQQWQIPEALQADLGQQVALGRVWLLLDGVDEMGGGAGADLAALGRQLRGWLAPAAVVLTCRLNTWDSGFNGLQGFRVFQNLGVDPALQEQFIDRWFQHQGSPALGQQLQAELHQPHRQTLGELLRNPLRLALLCRLWGLTQGTLPHTKAMLYQQLAEALYTWHQERCPTSPRQRHHLSQALGHLALEAFRRSPQPYRLSQTLAHTSLAHTSLAPDIDPLALALDLGWLSHLGLAPTTAEPVYGFYHPTFQEYFAAQAIPSPEVFLDPAQGYPLFQDPWGEVLGLWLGRSDLDSIPKETLLQQLITFPDDCGGFYGCQAHCWGAIALAEFPQSQQAGAILETIVHWRFGQDSPELLSRRQGASVALLKTDRPLAIAALEKFLGTVSHPFSQWNGAYTLGKVLDPGNGVAVATLTALLQEIRGTALIIKLCHSLVQVQPGHPGAIATLEHLLATPLPPPLQRKAAYTLGKGAPDHPRAIAALAHLIQSTPPSTALAHQAWANLATLQPHHPLVLAASPPLPAPILARKRRPSPQTLPLEIQQQRLHQRLTQATHPAQRRRLAHRLGSLQPGHPAAVATLVELLRSPQPPGLYRRLGEDLRQVVVPEQLPGLVTQLRPLYQPPQPSPQPSSTAAVRQFQTIDNLLGHCAQALPYGQFRTAWKAADPAPPIA